MEAAVVLEKGFYLFPSFLHLCIPQFRFDVIFLLINFSYHFFVMGQGDIAEILKLLIPLLCVAVIKNI